MDKYGHDFFRGLYKLIVPSFMYLVGLSWAYKNNSELVFIKILNSAFLLIFIGLILYFVRPQFYVDYIYFRLESSWSVVNISEMLQIIPELDTVVPMLKSFAGRAECHIAGEMYLKSNYDIKYSTLRGAVAIEGQDLVLLEGETFDKISKYLMNDGYIITKEEADIVYKNAILRFNK
jgi:hypothetical protein